MLRTKSCVMCDNDGDYNALFDMSLCNSCLAQVWKAVNNYEINHKGVNNK